jgi:putative transferase (TIGR04331 family)
LKLAKTRLENGDLFLGDWAGNGETVPFLWSSPEKMEKGFVEAEKVIENIFPKIIKELNRIHKVELTQRQYNILFGSWLRVFTHQSYDKYKHLKYAFENYPISTTDIADFGIIPISYNGYTDLLNCEKLHLQIYSQILEELNFPTTKIEAEPRENQNKYIVKTSRKNLLFKTLNLFSKSPKYTIVSPYFRYKTLFRYFQLAKTGKFRFDDFEYDIEVNVEADREFRNSLDFGSSENEFENILLKILPKNFPSIFIEGFSEFWQKTASLQIQKTGLYYTANGLYPNCLFKFFLAQNSLKVVSHQHGGSYGMHDFMPNEKYEKELSETFFTWGWSDEKSKYLPTPRLLFPKAQKGSKILLPLDFSFRYLHVFENHHISSIFKKYETSLWKLLENRKDVVLRDYFSHNKRETLSKIKIDFPKVQIENPRLISFDESLKETKLFISLHSSTTFLETLAQNIPTLILLNKKIYSFNKNFNLYLEILLKEKIAFETVEDLIEHLNIVAENPEKWWYSDEVQKARSQFVNQYARTSSDWVQEWVLEFEKV